MKANATRTAALKSRISHQKNQSLNLNDWIFENLSVPEEGHILELCCGTGSQTIYLSERIKSGSITSVDINPESLEVAKRNVGTNLVRFIQSDIDATDHFLDRDYDLIFVSYGFYYSKAPETLHSRLIERLSSQGKIAIIGPVLGNNAELFGLVRRLGGKIPPSVTDSSEEFMIRMLRTFLESFSSVKFSRATNTITYDSIDSFLEYWKNTTFYVPGLDEKFVSVARSYFPKEPVNRKSVGLLEGCL